MSVKEQRLEKRLREAEKSADLWQATARDMCNNAEYYRQIIANIGDLFGIAAYMSDDRSIQDHVLSAKVFDLVNELVELNNKIIREKAFNGVIIITREQESNGEKEKSRKVQCS